MHDHDNYCAHDYKYCSECEVYYCEKCKGEWHKDSVMGKMIHNQSILISAKMRELNKFPPL